MDLYLRDYISVIVKPLFNFMCCLSWLAAAWHGRSFMENVGGDNSLTTERNQSAREESVSPQNKGTLQYNS